MVLARPALVMQAIYLRVRRLPPLIIGHWLMDLMNVLFMLRVAWYGLGGVVTSAFLGWMLGKAMLETRGFLWAWVIHFIQDVLIFPFMAAGSITPGG